MWKTFLWGKEKVIFNGKKKEDSLKNKFKEHLEETGTNTLMETKKGLYFNNNISITRLKTASQGRKGWGTWN